MTTRSCAIRFCVNNFATSQYVSSYSSYLSGYPHTNALTDYRSKYWKFKGYFKIESTNNTLYINDGTNKTITLTTGTYNQTTLASHIQTQLNASSSAWTVTYLATNKFKIEHTGSATLRLSQSTNAVWSTLGFVTGIDETGTSFTAHVQRNHTEEFIIFDLGARTTIDFFAVIPPITENLSFSQSSSLKIQASNLNQWDSPPLDLTLTWHKNGLMRFLDDQTDTSYRYWKFKVVDQFNLNGPYIPVSKIFLGQYYTFDAGNIWKGFTHSLVDETAPVRSESGVLYFDSKTKYTQLENLNLGILERADMETLQAIFERIGLNNPFFISLDPLNNVTTDLQDLTKYVYFTNYPQYTHIIRDLYSTVLSCREVI